MQCLKVDRAPTGSGVTARVAVQFARGLIGVGQRRTFESAANSSKYVGSVVRTTQCGDHDAVIVEVSGTSYYCGTATFVAEDADELRAGFLLE
jgi:trans-L-3-hydroxyproline dehydratase